MAILQGNAKQGSTRGFYPRVINGSLRFNDNDSAYLSWTPASAGNRKTWTWSGWVKRGNIGTEQHLLAYYGDSTVNGYLFFSGTDNSQLRYREEVSNVAIVDVYTSALFRDPSAWYHVVLSVDTTQATNTDRVKIYINGEVQSFSSATYFSQNDDTNINNTVLHNIGQKGNSTNYLDGYLADVYFIDGQALSASDFGETKNGVWVAKDYAGTFGTNGFHLTFEDDTEVEAFNTVLWRGNGGTQSITGMGFQPDLVWLKERSSTSGHNLVDAVRGVSLRLASNTTSAEASSSTLMTSFDSDGFSVGNNGGSNESGQTYVAWGWKAGDSNVSNTDGSITSTVRANDTYGFSIVSWTATGTPSDTIGHGLSSTPDMIIVKDRDAVSDWCVYTQTTGAGAFLKLNDTAASTANTTMWNNTSPTSSVFNWGYSGGNDIIAYCWSEKANYSAFGDYTGNGSTTGPVITTGFKPSFVLIKKTSDTSNWSILDSTRSTSNDRQKVIWPNQSSAESDNVAYAIEFTDTGFQLKTSTGSLNETSGEYIYAAFADTREAAFWLDQSGNDNDWQPVNLDHNDTVADSPTDNFCTFNSVAPSTVVNGSVTLSDGNLVSTDGGTTYGLHSFGTIGVTSGKWYWETTLTSAGGVYANIGVVDLDKPLRTNDHTGIIYMQSGAKKSGDDVFPSGSGTAYGASYTTGDVIGIALNMDDNEITFYKNGVSQGVAFTGISGNYTPAVGDGQNATSYTFTLNCGQQDFDYTPPSGYLALSTANLPDPAIDPAQESSPADYFNTVLYTSTSASQSVTGVGFEPDWCWIKDRTSANSHHLFDQVRGAGKRLMSNETAAESTVTSFSSFDADGFTLGPQGQGITTNNNNYVAWSWKANGSGVSNTDGSITSTVSANTESGFSIVTYTGTGASATVGHGLSSTPDVLIIKNRDNTRNWAVWHSALGGDNLLTLNTSGAVASNSVYWGGGNHTSTVFELNTSTLSNESGLDHIAYCFHSVDGFSKFGSYTGNGSADGPFVYTGFRPAFLMVKRTDSTGNWQIYDTARDSFNYAGLSLAPNGSAAESDGGEDLDILSNGFKARDTAGARNASGGTYIFMAFSDANGPFKYSNAR